MVTFVESPLFTKQVHDYLTDTEYRVFQKYLAANPDIGNVVRGSGGVRKVRWSRRGTGKSGGVRVIYYFHNESMPLYLLTLFAKNDRSNLSQSQRNELSDLTRILVQEWERKQNEQ